MAQKRKSTKQTNKKSRQKERVQRVTIDFPIHVYEAMKEETEENGQTLKGFIVHLVKKKLDLQ